MILDRLVELRGLWPGDDPTWERLFGTYTPPTSSGIEVDEETALTFSAVFAAVRIISETVASLPLHVYERLQPQGKKRVPTHRLYSLLHDVPHEEMSSYAWREATISHVLLWGNAYSLIERFPKGMRLNGRRSPDAGQISRLLLLNPTRVRVVRDKDTDNIVYEFNHPTEGTKTYQREEVFHLHGLGFNGVTGYSVVSKARESMGLGLAAEKHGAATFGNGAYFRGFLKFPGEFKDEAARKRFRRDWNAQHRGVGKAGTVPILEQGLDWVSASMSNEDAQFLETRKFQTTEVARWFRLPPHMLGDLEKATFSNIEHQGIDFVVHSIGPWLSRFESEINRQLVSDAERATIFAEFLVDGLLRGDMKARMEGYTKGFQNGIYTLNEIRERENMNPLEEGGDIHFVPLNMQTLEKAMQEPEPAPTPEPAPESEPEPEADDETPSDEDGVRALSDALAPVFIAAARRILAKETKRLRAAAEKHQAENRIVDMPSWLDTFYNDHYGAVRAALEGPAWTIARLVKVTDSDRIADYLKQVSERYVVSAWDQARTAVIHAKDGIVVDAVHNLTDEWLSDQAVREMGEREAAYAIEYFSRRNGHAIANAEN